MIVILGLTSGLGDDDDKDGRPFVIATGNSD